MSSHERSKSQPRSSGWVGCSNLNEKPAFVDWTYMQKFRSLGNPRVTDESSRTALLISNSHPITEQSIATAVQSGDTASLLPLDGGLTNHRPEPHHVIRSCCYVQPAFRWFRVKTKGLTPELQRVQFPWDYNITQRFTRPFTITDQWVWSKFWSAQKYNVNCMSVSYKVGSMGLIEVLISP